MKDCKESKCMLNELEKVDDESVINGLIDYLINVYIYKYPIANFKNKKYELLVGFLENGMTAKQKEILRCSYCRQGTFIKENGYPLTLKIVINDEFGYKANCFIDIDEMTGIVDDYSIMFLSEYYHGLSNNITIERLAEIMVEQDLPFMDYSDIILYLREREKIIKIRKKVIMEVAESLYKSDSIKENGRYRMEKFLNEFNLFYNIGLEEDKVCEEITTDTIIKRKNKKLGN